jgi:hypothetical protein
MTDPERAITLKLRRDANYANETSCRRLVTRPPQQRAPCWTDVDKVEMIDTVLRGWICPPIYIIPRPELADSCPEGEDHVFDGAHKLEAVFDFMDDKFVLKATVTSGPIVRDHDGSKFSELPRALQEKIRTYRYQINNVDEETAGDPDQLRVLWERVNKAGKKLNKYELEIPVISPLIKHVLNPAGEVFKETLFFSKKVSMRGELEQRLQVLLALADIDEPRISSQNSLVQAWHATALGSTMTVREENVVKNAERWRGVLTRCHKMFKDLEQLNVFCDDDGVCTAQDALLKTELPFVLGRLARKFVRIEDFRSLKGKAAATLKAKIFSKTPQELSISLGGTGRNGSFQKKLLAFIDGIVEELAAGLHPRLFTREQKEAKLKEQGGCCAACGKKILAHHLMDGDHVREWSAGGETTMENLQILHRICHQAKTAGES